jgi:hypothetical protein
MLKSLSIHGWRQFESIHLDFHDKLTIITGANATGKSTILNTLCRTFTNPWSFQFASTIRVSNDIHGKRLAYFSDRIYPHVDKFNNPISPEQQLTIGDISFTTSPNVVKIQIPCTAGGLAVYTPSLTQGPNLSGVHLPSHRSPFNYRAITTIPIHYRTSREFYDHYVGQYKNKYLGEHGQPANEVLKSILICLGTFGFSSKHLKANLEYQKVFNGFVDTLAQVIPEHIGFKSLMVEPPEVIIQTASGDFPIDAASGGLSAMIDLAWQLYSFSLDNRNFCVTFDEPENHLHPGFQRHILPNLLKAFPNTQFIVVTHSPLIVTSVPESSVYVLDYDTNKKVVARQLDMETKALSSTEVLHQVLGVPFTMPIWVEEKLQKIIAKYISKGFSEKDVERLKLELDELGMGNLFPGAIDKIVNEIDDKAPEA